VRRNNGSKLTKPLQISDSLFQDLRSLITHFRHIIPLDDPLKRDSYAEMCRVERWSLRTLRQKISGMLFELGYSMRFALCSARSGGGLFDRASTQEAFAEQAP